MPKFKTRARAVDMLGRQQIANASTALSELFKNAYDAYAKHAEADLFRSDGLLVIRDDGCGMTVEDFESRWLVLGTDSKLAPESKDSTSYCPPGETRRPTMGEKGIGRLAIALLGPQVLVMTRAVRAKCVHDLVLSYVHWGVFTVPGLNLEDIEIPTATIPGGRLPTQKDVAELKGRFEETLGRLRMPGHKLLADEIRGQIRDFQVDPDDILGAIGGLSIADGSSGTQFYIAPANPAIAAEIDVERYSKRKDFSKFLLGFCNGTFAERRPLPIATAFRDRLTDTEATDLLAQGEFFTREELDSADHCIAGSVDEFGQFRGKVRVYEQEHPDHVIAWNEAVGQQTQCGPFGIEFGYVQGNLRESRMDPEAWARLNAKLGRIGGLYVYRDRIRVLPYGNSDFDWADIELNRNKGAGYYFFSYRRLFGAVCLTREDNQGLAEKAGREGFQHNLAYRQLKAIVGNLFIQLAADFFREGSDKWHQFSTRKSELTRIEEARRRRERLVSVKKGELTSALETFFRQSDQGLPETQVSEVRQQFTCRMQAAARLRSPNQAAAALLNAERDAMVRLDEIRKSHRVAKPRGVGLPRQLQRDWEAYLATQERLERDVFEPASREVASTLGRFAKEAKLLVDQRKRVQDLLRRMAESATASVQENFKGVKEAAAKTSQVVLRAASDSVAEMSKAIAEVEADFQREDLSALSPQGIEKVRRRLEQRIEDVGRSNTETLARIRDLLTGVAESLKETQGGTQLEAMEAVESELDGLREQADADVELVQLGLAVAVINHEFEAAIKGVRRALRSLHPWAMQNHELAPVYLEIRTTFDHLDGHLSLFTPLQRRLYRHPIAIKGSDLHHYVGALFEARIRRHGIELKATDRFLRSTTSGFPSTLYPVFVNVIDNAVFWQRDLRDRVKCIELNVRDDGYLVSNTGPAIPERDSEAIFEQGFTRKPGGRGLGLFISRKVLRREGMDIAVVQPEPPFRVGFLIKWKEERNAELPDD